MPEFFGTSGNDSLSGSETDDRLISRGGNDTVYGLGGNDILAGGPGQDTLYGGDGDDGFSASQGAETYDGGAGYDTVFYNLADNLQLDMTSASGTPGFAVGHSFVDIERISATGAADVLRLAPGGMDAEALGGHDRVIGSRGVNEIYGGTGDDRLAGRGGHDTLVGGLGDDRLNGNRGNDVLIGDEGDDILRGARRNDTLEGGDGDDRAFGGRGRDVLIDGEGDDLFVGGAGRDTFVFEGGPGDNTIRDYDPTEGDSLQLIAIPGVGVDMAALRTATETVDGNAEIDLGNGNSLTLLGVTEAQLFAEPGQILLG